MGVYRNAALCRVVLVRNKPKLVAIPFLLAWIYTISAENPERGLLVMIHCKTQSRDNAFIDAMLCQCILNPAGVLLMLCVFCGMYCFVVGFVGS